MLVNWFAIARRYMAKQLQEPGLRQAYLANMAMLLHDRYGMTDPKTHDAAAEDILTLIFESR